MTFDTVNSKPSGTKPTPEFLSPEETSANNSALGCALMRHVESIKPPAKRLFYDPYARLFLTEQYVQEYFTLKADSEQKDGWLVRLGALRERCFDEWINRAVNEEVRQLVLLGAGYEARALRMKALKHREILVYEIDQSFVIEQKKQKLLRHAKFLPSHLRFVSMNFHRDEFTELLRSGYNPDKKTLFVAQAVTYYLAPFAMEKIFKLLISNHQKGSALMFDYVDPLTMETMGGGGSYWDNVAGMRSFCIEPDILKEYLAQLGIPYVENHTMRKVEKLYTGNITLPVEGWYVALCRKVAMPKRM